MTARLTAQTLAHAVAADAPNALTAARFALALALAVGSTSALATPVVVFALFAVAAATDALDGFLARRRDARCPRARAFGATLDPLADKALVIAAVVAVFAQSPALGLAIAAPAAFIAAREMVIVWARAKRRASARRDEMPVTALSKAKTAVQMAACGALLGVSAAPALGLSTLAPALADGGVAALWLGAALGLVSAVDHLMSGRAKDRRRDGRWRTPLGRETARFHLRRRPGA